ncbi:MAG: phosphopyruvate hydratase [Bacteroidetes bacterium]|nr:phosphopyruvate hydratase [Bacteroidota bacterium]MDA1120495.1 phosphopyruvate hydratase [Bacteroidota bacterium]
MQRIRKVSALEILDSRGRPTVKAYCELDSGLIGAASVPSGASTGKAEAHELRDQEKRFNGMGCLKAVNNINVEINDALKGKEIKTQNELDKLLIELDGTPNKSRLGANALLAISISFARVAAKNNDQPLYQYFSNLADKPIKHLPRPTINLFSGGKHAGGQVPIQDLLLVPTQQTIMSSLDCTYRVYQAAAELSLKKYGTRALTADEGGLAPPFSSLKEMFDDALQSIENAGFVPGRDVMLALDVASSHFYNNGNYHLGDQVLDSEGMIDLLSDWVSQYPIVSIEDGLYEEDWQFWPTLKQRISSKCLVLGDDLLCTNPARIRRASKLGAANALLLKVNQIGTLTEALEALQLARGAGWKVTISARSGETEDNWLADLAVGWQGDQIKIGSITQSERLAKYNRLLEIEKEIGLPVINWPN